MLLSDTLRYSQMGSMKSSECLLPEGLGGVAGRPTLLKLLPLLWAYSPLPQYEE